MPEQDQPHPPPPALPPPGATPPPPLPPAPAAPRIAEPAMDPPNRWLPSLVWLIPLLAALIGLGLVAKSVLDQGPTVTVSFHTGEGLEPGKTKVKYKDVDIGLVTKIKLGQDLSRVLVSIEMTKEA